MKRSEIRERSRGLQRRPRISLRSSGLQKEKEAERRQTRISNLRAPACILSRLRGGQRRGRGARPRRQVNASRRTQNPRDAPPVGVPPRRLLQRANAAAQLRTRFLGRGVSCPSPASSSQTGHSAGRALLRSRPGAQVTSPRPREPHPLRRPVSPADVLRARDSVQSVT